MKGIDWQYQISDIKYRIYLEYISLKFKKMMSRYKENKIYNLEPTPDEAYLKFKDRDDDYEYFQYLCKHRPNEDIGNYFNSTVGLQDDRLESSLGLFN